MNFMNKNILLLTVLGLIAAAPSLHAGDFITIINPVPSGSGTVNGNPLIINGSSSQPNFNVRLFINSTEVSPTGTDGSGNWSQNIAGMGNGTYALTAYLSDILLNIYAINSVVFTVNNGDFVSINSPSEGQTISFDPVVISGSASQPNSTISILLDSNPIATTTTDANGNWSYTYTMVAANGVHTFLIELLDINNNQLASQTVDVVENIPFVFPSGASQIRFIDGDIPTSGSGSGVGYIYTVSGSTATINFVPAFSSTPSMVATGLRTSGSSTVSLSAVSTTAASIAFSTGTQKIHFTASALQ
jgi:hypothetical protein